MTRLALLFSCQVRHSCEKCDLKYFEGDYELKHPYVHFLQPEKKFQNKTDNLN